MNSKLLPLLIIQSAVTCIAQDLDMGTVIFANILYRHGDRTPIQNYPTDPYNESSWPVPYGQLTNLGKHEQLLLGRWLRKRYSHLISDKYTPFEIYVRSTDVDRTLMSAEANLAGLYPPEGNQVWDKIMWMPIPVHTLPETEDYVLAGKKHCPRYEHELKKVLTSPEMKRINERNKQVYTYLTENTGKKITNLKTAEEIYDVLYIENLYNKTLPNWTHKVFPDKLRPIAEESFKTNAYNKILQRLKIGSLLGEMINHMVQKSTNSLSPNRKIWVYSAHDETIANMLMTLNLFDSHCPPYTATILIDLRINAAKEYFVTISYKNETYGEPVLLTLPGCTALCPLKEFISLTRDVIPEDWEQECNENFEKYEGKINPGVVVGIISSSVLLLLILVTAIIGFTNWYQRREHNQYYDRLTTEAL